MILFLAGLCLKGDNNVCPPGSYVIPAAFALSGGFLALAIIGFLWLGYRSKR
jgi:hypothetical protein